MLYSGEAALGVQPWEAFLQFLVMFVLNEELGV